MASQPHMLRPRAGTYRYKYKWHSAAFLATMLVIAMTALGATIVSSRASSTPLLDNATMSAVREMASTRPPEKVPVAQAGDLQLMLPVYSGEITAIGYHAADSPDAVALTPIGHQVNGSIITRGINSLFPQGGFQYVTMGDDNGFGTATQAMDLGAPAGTRVYAPVNGVIAGIRSYAIDGHCPDVEIKVRPQSDATMLVVLTHIDQPQVTLGQPIRAGVTQLGAVRGLDGCVDQPLKRYTSDNGNHLQMQVDVVR